ncbi:MAG: hypothetical protein O9293_09880 [Porphyrobacter sp.]|nr:hypothetical protein [Porphyrobacter sp.]
MILRLFGLLVAAVALLSSPAQSQDVKYDATALRALEQLVDLPKAEQTCAKGEDDNLCAWIGLSYLTGTGVPKDIEKGRKLIFVACGLSNPLACAIYEADTGGYEPDLREILHPVFLMTCKAQRGGGVGCFNAAQQLSIGFDVKKDKPKAAGLYLEGCIQGHAKSCVSASQAAYQGVGRQVDMAAAFQYGSIGCDLGDGTACLMAIMATQTGKIAPLEPAQEAKLVQSACASGATQVCDNALAYAQARLPDAAAEAQAPLYARIGCEANRPLSCRGYGQILYDGKGIAKDEATALAAFDQGCTGKDAPSCYSFGAIALNAGDNARARIYLEKALALRPDFAAAKTALARLPAS